MVEPHVPSIVPRGNGHKGRGKPVRAAAPARGRRVMTGRSTPRWRRPGLALDGVSTLLHDLAAHLPAVLVMALVAGVLAMVFAPGHHR